MLLRLASNRCIYGAPAAYKGRGAPSKHGHKFKFNDPETWPDADETVEVEDEEIGRVVPASPVSDGQKTCLEIGVEEACAQPDRNRNSYRPPIIPVPSAPTQC